MIYNSRYFILLLTAVVAGLLHPSSLFSGTSSAHGDDLRDEKKVMVKVRLHTNLNPGYLFIRIETGPYILDCYDGKPRRLKEGETFMLARFREKVAVKIKSEPGFASDSIRIYDTSGNGKLMTATGAAGYAGLYSGQLDIYPDLNGLLVINRIDQEEYIGGVVLAEGGWKKHPEFYKTQAVIVRTYTQRYMGKHHTDGFDLCDDTHCQVFEGITQDSVIINAVKATDDLVITDTDSTMIISAFHSNCGGETTPSEYVWLTAMPYLKRVEDPWCLAYRNATWERNVSLNDWIGMLRRFGFNKPAGNPGVFSFSQPSRLQDYTIGEFTLPLRTIRQELNLRSSWFSVIPSGDSLLLTGRGYGHGVGLCQEGAMAMAAAGKKFDDIIRYYYQGVRILKGRDAKKNTAEAVIPENKPPK